jgi:hypothetical protein
VNVRCARLRIRSVGARIFFKRENFLEMNERAVRILSWGERMNGVAA